jgi:8-oxo-dGTP pyrophosphatase MutT (NUDIX family)
MISADLTDVGFPAEGTVFALSSFRLRVLDSPHPWVLENEAGIARNWEQEVSANPSLFNGQMVFQRRLSLDGGHIEGEAHMVPFAAFLHWRRLGRVAGGHHLFAMPMIVSADGAVIAIRMAETTANPGRVYSPAGSLDRSDVVDGLCDLESNMRRETREETGLDLDDMQADPACRAVHVANSVAFFRVFRSELDEQDMREHVMRHIADDPEPEISALLGIRSPDPAAHDYAPFMLPALDWIFKEGRIFKEGVK